MAHTTAVYIGIFIASLALLVGGITGFSVVSQSCCFGDDCPTEYQCVVEEPTNESLAATGLGIFLLMISLAGLQAHMFKKH